MTNKSIKVVSVICAALFIVLPFAFLVASPAGAETALPETGISLSGTKGNADWFKSDVVVTLGATDNSNTGINRTEYSFNGSVWQRYTGPFNVTKEGPSAIFYRSVDNASGVEMMKVRVVSIDRTAPSITYTLTPPPRSNGWSNKTMVLHFETSDSISGLAEHTPDATLTNEGTYSSLTGVATDVAGNTASITVPTVYIDRTPPFVGNLTVTGSTYVDNYISASAEAVEANPDRVEIGWGDNVVSESSISNGVARSMHAYKTPGKYTVTLIVVDMAGNLVLRSAEVTVESPGGPATPTPQPTAEPAVTPTPTPVPSPAATPAPGLALPLSAAAMLIGAVLCLRARKPDR